MDPMTIIIPVAACAVAYGFYRLWKGMRSGGSSGSGGSGGSSGGRGRER